MSIAAAIQPSNYEMVFDLTESWNLISAYHDPETPDVESIFGGIENQIMSTWKWENNNWSVWAPPSLMRADDLKSYLADKEFVLLKNIHCGEGFWVNLDSPQYLFISGTQSSDTASYLNKGWNLVGLKSDEITTVTDYILGKEDKIASIWKWLNNTWAVYLPGGGTETYAQSKGFMVLQDIEPSQGLWVNSTEAITLE